MMIFLALSTLCSPVLGKRQQEEDVKILYIMTSSSEYYTKPNNNNEKKPPKSDRFIDILLPVLESNLASILYEQPSSSRWTVDFYFISSYILTTLRQQQIQAVLNKFDSNIGFEFWDDATPFFPSSPKRRGNHQYQFGNYIRQQGKNLARQHRFVVRDKLPYYNVFMAWEDDMIIHASQIHYYLHYSNQIQQAISETMSSKHEKEMIYSQKNGNWAKRQRKLSSRFYGNLTHCNWMHLRPGFIRVEVLQQQQQKDAVTTLKQRRRMSRFYLNQNNKTYKEVPVDFDDGKDKDNNNNNILDPNICCQYTLLDKTKQQQQKNLNDSHLVLWETAINALSIREIPHLGWVALLPGPANFMFGVTNDVLGSLSVQDLTSSDVYPPKPFSSTDPNFIAQSGGWIMTREQILQSHLEICDTSFLPPIQFEHDGLYAPGVEWWSGGVQMWSGPGGGCSIQRFIPITTTTKEFGFSHALLFHAANNKQYTIHSQRHVKAKTLWGQLNYLRKLGEIKKRQEQEQANAKI